MPLRRQVNSLQQLCTSVIIENLSIYPIQELQTIPSNLSEDLVQYFNDVKENPTCRDLVNRNRLINANMKKLTVTFYRCSESLTSDTVNSVLKTCNSLTSFTCVMENEGSFTQHLLQLIHSIPNVVILKLEGKQVTDNILQAIGDNCPKLESLTCKSTKITDDGIRRLCRSKSGGSKIKHLELENCKVTPQCCVIALYHFKQLKILNCSGVIQAFKRLFQCLNGSSLPKFHLRELLVVPMYNLPKGMVNFITKCCPNLSSLTIDCSDNLANDFNELKNCSGLIPIKLTWQSITMTDLNSLEDLGAKLTSLCFIGTDVDLVSIGYRCPNLTELLLIEVTFQPFENVAKRNFCIPFTKLQNLYVSSLHCRFPISIPLLKFLLQNCLDLELLSIKNHALLTDDVLLSILQRLNPMRRLSDLRITNCNRLGKLFILNLLRMQNDLKSLTIHSCKSFSKNDKKEIQSYIKDNNYCISTNFILT